MKFSRTEEMGEENQRKLFVDALREGVSESE